MPQGFRHSDGHGRLPKATSNQLIWGRCYTKNKVTFCLRALPKKQSNWGYSQNSEYGERMRQQAIQGSSD
jgi:hypothetical protein